MTTRSGIGDAPKRREDLRFLTGNGRYLDDLSFAGVTHAVVLRSPHAHARILAIDATAARAAPGVLAVLTAADAAADGLNPLWPSPEANIQTGERFGFVPQPLLAAEIVRYVGEPVALIVGETHHQALDAAERVAVDYSPLPAVTTVADSCRSGAPQLAPQVPGNLCFKWQTGDPDAVAASFRTAAHLVFLGVDNHRVVTNPIEPRGIVGLYDAGEDRYTAYVSAQSIHATRDRAASALGVDSGRVRFIALDDAGRFLALRVESVADLGAYLAGGAGVQAFQYAFLPGTVYRIPAIELHISAVYTNTVPIGVLRGPGYGEANNIIERLIDVAAAQTGLDRAELRRRNLVPAAAMPMTNAVGNRVDSGSFPETFEKALAAADLAGFAGRCRDSAARGQLRGLGFAYHIKGTGGSPSENVDIRFEADGS